MARSYFTRNKKTYWRINESIQAPSLRVVGPEGRQLGVFSSREANDKAREVGMDLVEIAPKANPPVAKIIDFVKFKYQQEKKEKEQKLKERRGTEQKQIWLTPFIAENDYQVRLARIKEFLKDGFKVRVIIKFTGRQMGHKEFGYKIIDKVERDTVEIGKLDGQPKFLGRQLMVGLSPSKKQAKVNQNTEGANEKNEIEDQKIDNA
ncbi:MAG: translation initiation factor IF-3 [Candidatus Blackburnbacteria bacterium RIFCSPHIGHO2_02_FULL_39_13]|uniref:Translation initiation factor IF-3 n=1 Tax=Candidatus Blackburnbacteria bacterium RIFCSPLOWO2_01_FULL_40_20 TaxID=1797519 RepID=A0A1G1VFI8_9BACT|nr:MAG: Translation initiation factor IF-3 [Microgenomates group bacterium GW2011_GWA2_39_19]OGY07235.1 MAG: translation initiation factor IF-3 [Candidatus Blackburnbacteria bacterium RIFCSPHIGHO2_01_FULL_40_17]OGY09458.1 MAG: translation initiation factor IF-3 [Candidatus Blackburnbacteria bacterium RIFCSPHIGHO2_02_FULL_39_13]OGY14036.1 MAG: translation initiation factor IF-3 [Candidatus Blackburnbacteria bacterium RIFCSPLOWO2_01_FULL_40_20]OGY15728.1 MAG: translation initiation factor IF-3 [C